MEFMKTSFRRRLQTATASVAVIAQLAGASGTIYAQTANSGSVRPGEPVTLNFTFTGGPVPSLQLDTIEGALQLKGSGSWVGSRLRFTGEASAAPDREAALANLLNIIGRRNGSRSLITVG